MAEINLTEEDMLTLQRYLNEGIEPPQELAQKLFPSMYASFDFKTLKDSKIPTIEYQGKRAEAAILSEASVFGGGSPLQLERCFDGGRINKNATQLQLFNESTLADDTNWRNLIVQGDNLQFLKTCYINQDPIIKDRVKGKVKLVCIDPPFATRSDFASKEGEDSYSDKIDRAEFVEVLRERLIYLRELMTIDGAIYLHLDSKMHHYMRVVMDEVFGKDNFRNEIYARRIRKNVREREEVPRLNDAVDVILFYAKSGSHLIRPSVKYSPKGERWHGFDAPEYRKGMDYELFGVRPESARHWMWDENKALAAIEKGILRPNRNTGKPEYLIKASEYDLRDSLWDDITASAFTTGYPTEKKEELIENFLHQSSKEDDLVIDVFAGSGTTAAVAEKRGRRWIMCDFGKHAIYTMQKRMCLIADSQNLGTQGKKKGKYGKPPKPFCVVSVGAFDFLKIMKLRENREAYVAFVLGIFGITDREDSLDKKYKVSNVCALKNGNPVEVYPIWDDEFLKNIRVDEDYLKGILAQSGGKLKGDYYIVAPETCVRIGETELKNAKGDKVTFKMLTFPYKVLEEIARNFSIEEQPSSPDNINKLISSVGFYFNEEVKIEVKKTTKGFKIKKFKTSILNSEEMRYEGLDGLAMILVDTEYDDEKGFTVDTVIYQKDIKEEEVHAGEITADSAIIAIDKHGNESKVTMIR